MLDGFVMYVDKVGIPLAFAYPGTRRLKRPAIRMRCALSKSLFRAVVQPTPPGPKATGRVAQPEVAVQHNAIDAVIAAG